VALRRPDNLKPDEQIRLKQVLAHCAQLEAAATHTASFAEMMCQRRGERLDEWIDAVEADELPELHRFTTGIRRDHAAVLAGLTQAHNSGPVEGTVNKIKERFDFWSSAAPRAAPFARVRVRVSC
jgi:transposase